MITTLIRPERRCAMSGSAPPAITVSVVFTWYVSSTATKYVLETSATDADPWTTVVELGDVQATTRDVGIGAAYWRVLAYNGETLVFTFASTLVTITGNETEAVEVTWAPPQQTSMPFVWNDVVDATSYVLQIGRGGGTWPIFNADVGNVLTYTVGLSDGSYLSRVVPYQGASPMTATDAQFFTVGAYQPVRMRRNGGQYFNCYIKDDGTLWTVGINNYYQLGDDSTTDRTTLAQVGSSNAWIAVECGYYHVLALQSDYTLWAWGYNGQGETGWGQGATRIHVPTQIGTDYWLTVSGNEHHSLGVKLDGTLWAWGDNTYGQIGDGTVTRRYTPVQIGSDSDWVEISAGMWHSLGLKTDGSLWAWGRNYRGELGNGTNVDEHAPVRVGTDTWIDLSCGLMHSVGIKADGTLWVWGGNHAGELGTGGHTDSWSPVQLGVGTAYVYAIADDGSTHAIDSTGKRWATGGNEEGEIADGTFVDEHTWKQIGAETDWISISRGIFHASAERTAGVYAWGDNSYGQLGDGTTTNRNVPVEITV